MTNLLIDAHLKRLRMPAMARNYAKMAEEARDNNQSFESYLLALLDQEIGQREENVQAARVRQAKFPAQKTLEAFDFTLVPKVSPQKVLNLAQADYVAKHENVILVGPNGTGKTHLAIGLGIAACRRGKRVRFTTAPALVNDLIEARQDYRLSRLQAYYQRIDLLILDEFGFVPFPRDGAELLFNLVASRYERRSTVLTTNLEFGRWTEVLGDEMMTGALVDRLTHQAHILLIEGESYRFRQSLKNSKREKKKDS